MMHTFYYRKGIAEFLLNYEKALVLDSLNKSIQLLEIQGFNSLANQYKVITLEKYQLII
ncbi:MAG: hypothetical protein JEZ08_25020 [Clostridiales bacterium]|nr:hypothetical protein [Clostridiales bacterium]